MSTGIIKYTEPEMEIAIKSINSTAQNYDNQIHALEQTMNASTQHWMAEPKRLYEEKRANWDRQAADRSAKLAALPGLMNQIATTYAETNNAVRKVWGY